MNIKWILISIFLFLICVAICSAVPTSAIVGAIGLIFILIVISGLIIILSITVKAIKDIFRNE